MSHDREANVVRYERLIASFPGVERKGKANPYTSHAGNMFSFITQEGGLALRLGKQDRERFLVEHDTVIVRQYGYNMPEYVLVPDSLLRRTASIEKWFAVSVEYVRSLKPKPTTRKKATGKKAAKK